MEEQDNFAGLAELLRRKCGPPHTGLEEDGRTAEFPVPMIQRAAAAIDAYRKANVRTQRAEAERDRLRKALTHARPLVEKWCHYQGSTPELFAQYLDPIDSALATLDQESGE